MPAPKKKKTKLKKVEMINLYSSKENCFNLQKAQDIQQ